MQGADSLTVMECDQLIQAVDALNGNLAIRDKMLVEVMASTGLRVSELVALRVDQMVDGGRAFQTLHLKASTTKLKRGGKLPLPLRLQGSLESYVIWLRGWYDGCWLFPGYEGNHLSTRSVQLIVKKLKQKAGLMKKISPHSLRKFYIQRLFDQGLDIRTVLECSRHKSMDSLHCYLIVNEEGIRQAVEKIR